LFYRLNGISIPLAPLRERKEDIPALVEHFLNTRRVGRAKWTIDPAALSALVSYNWPGNIRELANVIERAQILAEGDTITPDDLPDTVTLAAPSAMPGPAATAEADPRSLDEVERRHVMRVLREMNGNKVQSAKALGISRRALYRLIDRYRLDEKPAPAETKAAN